MRTTIRTRILFIFTGIAFIQALLLGAFFLHQRNTSNKNFVTLQLQSACKEINTQLSIFLNSLLGNLETATQQVERMAQKEYQQHNLLTSLKDKTKEFQALNYYDINGIIKCSVSRLPLGEIPQNFTNDPVLFTFPFRTGKPFFSSLATNEDNLAFAISHPIYFLDKSYIVGVISALVSFDTIQHLIDQIDIPKHSNILVITSEGKVVAQRWDNMLPLQVSPPDQRWNGDIVINHTRYISASSLLDFHGQQLTIVSTIDTDKSLAPSVRSFMLLMLLPFLLLILSAIVGWTTYKKIIEPLQILAEVPSPLSQREEIEFVSPVDTELHTLADTLNTLNTQLRESYSQLEEEVIKRRREEKIAILSKIEAEKANQAKSIFLANMSHEIRTPLHGMIGMLEMIGKEPMSRQQQHLLSMTKTSGQRLQTVVESILDLSLVESGKFSLYKAPFVLSELILEVTDLMKVQVENQNKEISIHSTQADDTPNNLIGDSGRIRQILINLINNSIKFSDKGRIILTISLQEKLAGHKVILLFTIQDSGNGIPESAATTIFDAFERGKIGNSNVIEGTGLGLTISAEFVQHMQGKLWLASTGENGSTFCFTIQCALDCTPTPQANNKEIPKKNQTEPLKGIRIFLAEDEFINQRIISAYLEEHGGEVTICANGQELLDAMQKEPGDIILMDVRMPVLNGLETTKIIRAQETEGALLPIPIVALTAQATTDFEQQCKDAGMDAYLTKPISFDKLVETIYKYAKK